MLAYIPAASFVPPTNMPAPTLTLVFASAFYLPVLRAIDVAEHGKNVTRRERFQQNVAGTKIAAGTNIAAKSKIVGSIKN